MIAIYQQDKQPMDFYTGVPKFICRSIHNSPIVCVHNYRDGVKEKRRLMASEYLCGMVIGTIATSALAPWVAIKGIHTIDLYVNGRYEIERSARDSSSVIDTVGRSVCDDCYKYFCVHCSMPFGTSCND
jgi:hypothetical protein